MKDEETKAKQKTEDESKKSTEDSEQKIYETSTDYSIINKKENNNEEIISEQDINNTLIFSKNINLNSDYLKINTPKNLSDIDLDETKDLIQGLLSDLIFIFEYILSYLNIIYHPYHIFIFFE